jgi:hypothetical protein
MNLSNKNKRDEKAAGKLQEQMEKESIMSGKSMISGSSKVSKAVGSKLSNRAIVKEVQEDNWELTERKDKNSNKFYCCKHCQHECRKYDRKTHKCDV